MVMNTIMSESLKPFDFLVNELSPQSYLFNTFKKIQIYSK